MPGPDAQSDLALLIEAAHEAGEIAKRYFGADPTVWEKDAGAGPVTEADLAVDAMLRRELLAARPGYGWLSEETEDNAARLTKERVFIVDPIDGTKAFIDGTTAFAHSLAVVENGQPIAAVVLLPMKGRLYAARQGSGTTMNGEPVAIRTTEHLSEAEVLATRPTMGDAHWPKGVPTIRRVYRPSLAYRLALVGSGRFDGMATFRPTWEWDIAAGALLVSEAGGMVSDGKGEPLRFNNPVPQVDGVLSGAPKVHAALLAARI